MPANNITPQVRSMTGYALVESSNNPALGGLSLTVELRGVNGRFLDLTIKAPDELKVAEAALREVLQASIARGKIEARLQRDAGNKAANMNSPRALVLNHELAESVARMGREAQALVQGSPLSVHELLRWPGVVQDENHESPVPPEAWVEAVRALAALAAADFNASRGREGDKLKAMLLDRVAAIEAWVAKLTPLLPEAVAAYRQKLLEKMAEAVASVAVPQAASPQGVAASLMDNERVRAEAALYAVKIDVSEELVRLSAHCSETRRLLDNPPREGVGKRLDFLMQEFNREANTLGSKSVSLLFGQASVEMKVLIEQMREQVQNLE
jgi:uncharacterized protein (TIGR00255 family)